jgi:hypothetical protein
MSNGSGNPVYGQHPINWSLAVGLTSIRVLPVNNVRKRLMFHNPHATANIAVCCVVDQNGNALPAAINGQGSIVLSPLTTFEVRKHPVSAWNAISDDAAGQLTILEFIY